MVPASGTRSRRAAGIGLTWMRSSGLDSAKSGARAADPGSTDSAWSTYEPIRRTACEGRFSWVSIHLRPGCITGRGDPLATFCSRIGDTCCPG